jgi:alpha,alpha-trehalase
MEIHELDPLFEDVQVQDVLIDGKTFPDCLPKRKLEEIRQDYSVKKGQAGFDLKKFVIENFTLPDTPTSAYRSDTNKPIEEHITNLWKTLTRLPNYEVSSLIPMPNPYVVPGGRFREIYYWDSYFTMLGLCASDRLDLVEGMVENFVFLISKIGYIPNGNRTYYIGRSQPPFFALMVRLLHDAKKTEDTLVKYLPALEKEYQFWMKGKADLKEVAQMRVVKMPNGSFLNRYWDDHQTPRPESYKEDVELSHQSKQKPEELYRHIRAAAESGWDFSCRWFKDVNNFGTIHTTDIVPIDLNCLLYNLEKTISDAYRISGNAVKATEYLKLANERKAAILLYCWDGERNFFFDYDAVLQKRKDAYSLAATFPLFFEIATPNQASAVADILEKQFLKYGGFSTTLVATGQQWDAPNGWAPLQWMTYVGLKNYGFDSLAQEGRRRWFNIIDKVYKTTGKMTEKYDVWSAHGEASGGEYPNQDGFGWTNGVYLAMAQDAT